MSEIVKYGFRTRCWGGTQVLRVKVKWRGPSFPTYTIRDHVEWRDATREEAEDFLFRAAPPSPHTTEEG